MNGELHPETLAIRGAKEQTNYNEHNQVYHQQLHV